MVERTVRQATGMLLVALMILAGCSSSSQAGEQTTSSESDTETSAGPASPDTLDDAGGAESAHLIELPHVAESIDEISPDGVTSPDVYVDEIPTEPALENADVVVYVSHEPGFTQPETTTVVVGTTVAVAVRTPLEGDLAVPGVTGTFPTNGEAAVLVMVADRVGILDVTVDTEVVARLAVIPADT
ncbi:MAG: hypothetical protein GY708_26145 [Actinomycetia bacterium]|nr:hypothetical protein [Actinomycetes bacterium]